MTADSPKTNRNGAPRDDLDACRCTLPDNTSDVPERDSRGSMVTRCMACERRIEIGVDLYILRNCADGYVRASCTACFWAAARKVEVE
jgi:hypothetical protein